MKRHDVFGFQGALVCGLICFCIFGIAVNNAGAVITMKFSHYVDESHPLHKAAMQFAERVAERTNGEVKVTVYPANTLGSPPEQCEQVHLGVLDMSLNTQGQTEYYVKASATPQIPFIFDDYDHAHRTVDGPAMEWMAPKFKEAGMIVLANWEWGFRNITNNKRPINTPDDVKGLKIRVPPEFHLQALFESLGAVVTKIAWPELYMALAQDVVDGQENPLSAIYYQKFYEVQRYLALTRHTYSCSMHLISTKSWAKLNDEQKKIFKEESKRAGDFAREVLNNEEKDLIAKMKKAGLQVTEPDPAPFRVAAKPAYEKIYDRYGRENVAKFMQFVEEARQK
jgi:tripartite ATP-independent transporter DctP family solute receptor